jgi:lipopolysaccharide transport system ATP-binding protein
MASPIISIENLGKKYLIHHQNGGGQGLRHVLNDFLSRPWSIARKLFQRTPRASVNGHARRLARREEFWALREVSLEIRRGEVVGVVGRNGAGKSTLLKLLSRITEPTAGRIRMDGRVASLLEVGTGFHPELTGRENIFLNGAILGMSRAEIRRKFDEIVAFAEVDRFLDTPVKRYSSGMYVRLAFAVAAHLEPEILIIDEVLAVGDMQFQRKCLGRMQEVAQREGRTVLFVSHNMAAVRSLCTRGIFLRDGRLHAQGRVADVLDLYLSQDADHTSRVRWNRTNAPQSEEIRFCEAAVMNNEGDYASSLDLAKPFSVSLEYEVLKPLRRLRIGFMLTNVEGVVICGAADQDACEDDLRGPGRYVSRCTFPGHVLNAGVYTFLFGADVPPHTVPLVLTPNCLSFSAEDLAGDGSWKGKLPGVLRPKLQWEVVKADDNAVKVSFSTTLLS